MVRPSGILHPLDFVSLGRCVPWMMRPAYNPSLTDGSCYLGTDWPYGGLGRIGRFLGPQRSRDSLVIVRGTEPPRIFVWEHSVRGHIVMASLFLSCREAETSHTLPNSPTTLQVNCNLYSDLLFIFLRFCIFRHRLLFNSCLMLKTKDKNLCGIITPGFFPFVGIISTPWQSCNLSSLCVAVELKLCPLCSTR